MKIDEADLRIGNWILDFGERPHQLSKALLIAYFQGAFNYFAPLPLTEEILIKSGFEKDGPNTYLHIDLEGKGVYFEGAYLGAGEDWNFDGINICGDFDECAHVKLPQFVHQLQNLYFALTGNELLLKL